MKKFLLFFGLLMGFAGFIKAQNVNIPDANFKAYLLGNSSINTVNDGEISVAEAEAFTGTINCSSLNIADLTGIEAFVNIPTLYCGNNQLTSLNVSKNTALMLLWCYNSRLTSLDVTKNIALTYLDCSVNQLTSLDVSKNTALTDFRCYSNQLTSLNLKNGQNTKITTFNTTSNPNLTCIQVDNVANANSYSNWIKPATASYSEDCEATLAVTDISKKEIALYPNPVKEILYFSEEVSNVKITDLSGRTVKHVSAKGKSVNVSTFANGVYVISAVTKEGKTITRKIVKE